MKQYQMKVMTEQEICAHFRSECEKAFKTKIEPGSMLNEFIEATLGCDALNYQSVCETICEIMSINDQMHSFVVDFEITPECQHEMTEYFGFSESYRYCKKCDHKETA